MRLVGATTTALMTMAVGSVVAAQSVPAMSKFEVVSIRPLADTTLSFRFSEAGQTLLRITAQGQLVGRSNLRGIIYLAYGATPYEKIVAAEPSAERLLDKLFEVKAVPPESSSPPNHIEVKAMIRQMLAERFGIKIRVDTELVDATVLRIIKAGRLGPGLRPAPEGCSPLPAGATPYNAKFDDAYRRSCIVTFFDGRIRGTVTLDEFARSLGSKARRPFLNYTDLEGTFNIDIVAARVSFTPDVSGPGGAPRLGENNAPALVDALRDQLGLAARTERNPIRVFVVENIGPFVEN